MGAGSSTSENLSTQITRSNITISDGTSQYCKGTLTQEEFIGASGNASILVGPGGQINQSESATMNFACLSQISNSSEVVNQISQSATQLAKAIGQSVTIGYEKDAAKNVVDSIIQNGITVQNQSYQTCSTSAFQSEQIVVTDNATLQVLQGTINQSETATVINQCTLNSTDTTQVQSSLSNAISQTAVAIEQNSLAILAIAVIFVVILFFFFEFGVVELLNWKTLLVVGVFVIVYILVSYWLGIWPFKAKAKTPPPSS